MNPKRQVIEQAIMDLEENREMVSQIYNEYRETKQGPGYYKKVEELDAAMEKAREERTNIAVRLFRDYVDYQGNPVVGNPNEAFYDPNPTPIFSVGDFHRGRPGGRHFPRTMPAITGARTKHAQTGRSTLRRIDKFIEQLKYKMKKRKDLQESDLFQLTEAKLKQLIKEIMENNHGYSNKR